MSRWLPGQARLTLLAALTTWLTGLTLAPLFELQRFIVVAFGSTLVVALVGLGLRIVRTPWPVVVFLQVVALGEWAVVAFAGQQATLGVIPNVAAVERIRAVLADGVDTANHYAPPVPDDAGLVLFCALGVAAIAIVVDCIGVALEHVPLAGLPLLALYTVPVATVPSGVPALLFIPGALGFVALLGAEERERVSHWGRQIARTGHLLPGEERDRVHTGALVAAGRRIGFTAVALAVVLPAILPTFPERLFGDGHGPGDGDGPLQIANPILDLKRDLVRPDDVDEIVLRTNDPNPGYLRLTALDEFDGTSWRPSAREIPQSQRATAGLPPPPGLSPSVHTDPVHYDIRVLDGLSSSWLPAPYPTSDVKVTGDWRYSLANFDILSANSNVTTAGLDYSLDASLVTPSAEQLLAAGTAPAALLEQFTALPPSLPAQVLATSTVVAGNAATDFERAVALQDWFRRTGGFQYSTQKIDGSSTETLVSFLTTNRVGYCEQFASAMALMARSLDIPARVAVGFLRPEQQADPNTYVYSAHDLHAWPELYFQGVGWVRFEPTPAVRTGTTPDYTHDVDGAGLPTPEPSAAPSAPGRDFENRDPLKSDAAAADAAGGGGGSSLLLPWPWLLAAALFLLLLAGPALARVAVRRWRWRHADTPQAVAEVAWDELRDTVRDHGLPWRDGLTPRGTGRALLASLRNDPRAADALTALVRFVERARYARAVAVDDDARAHVETVVAVIREQASRGRRIQAVMLAGSLVPDLAGEARRVSARLRGGRDPELDLSVRDVASPS